MVSLLESKGVPSYTFTEVDNVDVMPILALISLRQNDWNLESEKIVEREGKKTPGLYRYRAGKEKAEQAAWEFVNENKDLHFDLTTILPSVVCCFTSCQSPMEPNHRLIASGLRRK